MNIPPINAPGRPTDPPVRSTPPQAAPRRALAVVAGNGATSPAPDKAAPGKAAAAGASKEPDKGLESELAAANQKLAEGGHEVRFEFDREANVLIVRLIDVGTNKVLRQFPSNEALRAARLVNAGKPLISLLA